jgi:hypothetical protein
VIVDDGVQIGDAKFGAAVPVAFTGSVRSGGSVRFSLLAVDGAVPATVGDVAELGDVDMNHRTRVGVFITAYRLAGDPVDTAQPVDAATDQHGVHGRGRQSEPAGDLHRPEPVTPAQPHDLTHYTATDVVLAALAEGNRRARRVDQWHCHDADGSGRRLLRLVDVVRVSWALFAPGTAFNIVDVLLLVVLPIGWLSVGRTDLRRAVDNPLTS